MAKQYGKNNAVDFAAANLMSFGKSFSRLNGQPLDKSEIWYNDFAALEAYALTDAAYVGQKVVYIDTTAGTVAHYSIELNGTLKPVGDTEKLEAYIGEIPEGSDAETIIEYINEKTSGIATDTALSELQSDVDKLETAVGGAESGLVKDVADLKTQVGEGPVSDQIDAKITDLDLANTYEAKGAAETAKGEIEDVIGEVAEGKTVVEMIADAKDEATYDDTEVRGLIKDNADAIDVIESTYAKSSDVYTKTESDSAIQTAADAAEESAVDRVLGYLAEEEVNTSYDTLKEVAAWIESDTTASAELVTRVSNIERDYLKGADKTELQDQINELDLYIGELPEGAVSNTVVAYIQEVVDALKIDDYAKASDLLALTGRVTTAEGKITALEGTVDTKVDKVEGSRLMTEDEGAKLEAIEAGAQVNKIETVSAEFDLTDEHLSVAEIAQSKVTGLTDTLEGKVDKVAGSRLMTQSEADKLEKLVMGDDGSVSISGTVAAGNVSGLGEWITARASSLEGLSENNLSDTLLNKLNGISEGAQVNVIDAVSSEFTISADSKVLNVNAIEQAKITGLLDALTNRVVVEEGKSLVDDNLISKLEAIEAGAQVNVLESVKVGDTVLSIVDKAVTIPVATADAFGVVKSSTDANKISVNADGIMEVNSLNVDKLTQTENSYLIMHGGSANL